MSGGAFDYMEYRLGDWADQIQDNIDDNEIPYDCSFTPDQWTGRRYSDETLAEFKETIKLLRQCKVRLKRIDYLLDGDDSEESFHKRLKEELDKLEETGYGREYPREIGDEDC